mmetsp:Transcript_151971/g.269230  ORF Transcript_151971/g.269230 Transcript_151971/m.269230 type:complete len:414 (+) Transcript_151971:201-1442(+)
MPLCHKEGVLLAHNQLRSRHGSPPLQWSDECMVYAQKCADENSAMRRVHHAFLETELTDRKMGQNIYLGGGPVENAILYWYEEGEKYDYDKPGFQEGTGQFTAIVWYDTTHVGMARSSCGSYLVANYFPPGNWNEPEVFRRNVLPLHAAYAWRPRNAFEQRLADHFRKMAKDEGDGLQVPATQLINYLQALGERQLADAVAESDADGDGHIHAGEFIAAACTLKQSDQSNSKDLERDVRRIVGFVHVDENGDGLLDENEFLRYLTTLTHRRLSVSDAQELLHQFDTDGNGHLDYMELLAMHDSGVLQRLNESVIVKSWSKQVQNLLKDVPLKDVIDALRAHVEGGGEARVLKTDNQLIVKLISVSSTGHKRFQTLEGTWDSRRAVARAGGRRISDVSSDRPARARRQKGSAHR